MTTTITSEDELDLEVAYIAELIDLEERLNLDAPERYTAEGKKLDPSSWIWKFNLLDAESGEPIQRVPPRMVGRRTSAAPRPVEVWLWSSRNTRYDPKGRYTAKARAYMHALSGQVLVEREVSELLETSGLPFGLCGRRCLLGLERYVPESGRPRLSAIELRDMDGTLWWRRTK